MFSIMMCFRTTMKLLTHNFLSSRFLKEAKNGYPLILRCTNAQKLESEFNKEFMISMMPKIEYSVLRNAAESLGEAGNLPVTLPEVANMHDLPEDLLKEIHRVLLCIDIIEGELECPDTGRKFPIKDGIPNMLTNENEVA